MKKILMIVLVMCISSTAFAQNMGKFKYLTDLASGKGRGSKVERTYQQKLNDKEIQQYGYDELQNKSKYISAGGVQDSYMLGSGDQLKVSLVGGKTETYEADVDKQGQVIIEGLSPISASGLSMAEFESILQSSVSLMYLDTEVYVTLDKVRLINVIISGEVTNPGTYNLNALSKVSDLISLAGGVKKTGSLRKITVVSGKEKSVVDLYELFAGNNGFKEIQLKHGDRVSIPTIGETIAVVGDAENECIFEMNGDDTALIEKIAGVIPSDDIQTADFGNGHILIVSDLDENSNIVELIKSGKTQIFSLANREYLSDILKRTNNDFKKDMYPLFGIMERFDDENLMTNAILFNPSLVLRKKREIKLLEGDKIILFSKEEINAFQKPKDDDEELEINKYANLLENNSVAIYGEVMREGNYPIIDSITAKELIGVSGGLLPSAVEESIEVTKGNGSIAESENYTLEDLNTKAIKISSGDSVRIKSKFDLIETGSISIAGEVKYPGKYTFVRGEKLSNLIKRAGGLTEEAYSYGTVYSRESARIKEKEKYKQAARDLERSLAQYMAQEKEPNNRQIQYSRELIEEINSVQPLGRIVVEASPDVLRTQPEKDILLQVGDKIYIPKRSLTVHVMGEVLNPSNLQFESGKDAMNYIVESGGYSYYADKDRSFILLPNGSSKPIKGSSWNFADASIPEGSTVIVPRDPDPYNFMDTSLFITNVLSQIAITTAAIADIKD